MYKKLLSVILSIAIMVSFMPMQTYYTLAKVKTKATVSTQAGVKKAFRNKSLKTLTIKTNKKKNFNIPSAKNKEVKLILKAPNSKVKIKTKEILLQINKINKITIATDGKVTIKSSLAKQLDIVLADGVKADIVNKTKSAIVTIRNSKGEIVGTVSAGKSESVALDKNGAKTSQKQGGGAVPGSKKEGPGKDKETSADAKEGPSTGETSADAEKIEDEQEQKEEKSQEQGKNPLGPEEGKDTKTKRI